MTINANERDNRNYPLAEVLVDDHLHETLWYLHVLTCGDDELDDTTALGQGPQSDPVLRAYNT